MDLKARLQSLVDHKHTGGGENLILGYLGILAILSFMAASQLGILMAQALPQCLQSLLHAPLQLVQGEAWG